MKAEMTLAAVAALLLAGCGSGATGSSSSPAVTSGVLGTSVTAQTITVVGTGSVNARPDTAMVTLGVTMTGVGVSDAITATEHAEAKLMSALTGSGVAQDDIATTQYSVGPHWNPVLQRNDGWEVRDGFTVVVRDVGKVGSVIDGAAAALPNVFWVQGVEFQRTSTSDIADGARDAAMKDARARATAWAQLAGKTLGDVVSVSETQAAAPYTMPAGGIGGAGTAGIVSAPGKLTVTVTVVFAMS